MTWKKVNNADTGTATKFGGDDTDKISNAFSGTDVDDFDINCDFKIRSGKLQQRNPANTFSYIHTPGAIIADRIINYPVLAGTDTLTFDSHATTLANKTLASSCNLTAIPIDTLNAGTDITTNNVSTTKHGLTPKLPNDATKYLDGTGAYTVPTAGAPVGAQYVTLTTDATLTAERTLAVDDGFALTDGGAGSTVKISRSLRDEASKHYFMITDCCGATLPPDFQSAIVGDASLGNTLPAGQTQIGLWSLSTGTAATNSIGIRTSTNMLSGFAQGPWIFEANVSFPVLSTSAQRYQFRIGFIDQTTIDADDGAYFEYDELSDTHWRINTANNSVRTKTNTTVTVTAAQYYTLRIEVNAAGTSISYFIDGTQVSGSPITTNIPAAGRSFGLGLALIKSVGTTAVVARVDWMLADCDLTTPR